VTGRLRAVAAVHVGLLALVSVWSAYWQVIRGPDLAHHPNNPRLLLAEERVLRGRILDRRLQVLADSVSRGGRRVRVYPAGEVFAHPVGYRSLLLGKAGLEASADAELLGVADPDTWAQLRGRVGGTRRGLDVVTTLDARLQRAAWGALGPRAGAVVVVELGTGGVLASSSRPGFDPNRLEQTWSELRWSPTSPLLDRALNAVYPPGRAFGLVVLSAALSRGLVTLDSPADCGAGAASAQVVRHVLGPGCARALVQLAQSVGWPTVRQTAEAFGLGRPPVADVAAAAGRLPDLDAHASDGLAEVASGRGGVLASALQLASVAATVGRGGERVQPYFVRGVLDRSGTVVERPARPQARILAAEVAAAVLEAMRSSGVGRAAGVHDTVRAGGRTVGWFVGVAPATKPRVAVAVVVEEAGGEVAAAVAEKVVDVALQVVR